MKSQAKRIRKSVRTSGWRSAYDCLPHWLCNGAVKTPDAVVKSVFVDSSNPGNFGARPSICEHVENRVVGDSENRGGDTPLPASADSLANQVLFKRPNGYRESCGQLRATQAGGGEAGKLCGVYVLCSGHYAACFVLESSGQIPRHVSWQIIFLVMTPPDSDSIRLASDGFMFLRPVRHWYRYCSFILSFSAHACRSDGVISCSMRHILALRTDNGKRFANVYAKNLL
jgi:hypothetical protein